METAARGVILDWANVRGMYKPGSDDRKHHAILSPHPNPIFFLFPCGITNGVSVKLIQGISKKLIKDQRSSSEFYRLIKMRIYNRDECVCVCVGGASNWD